jgi:hypothetical protein
MQFEFKTVDTSTMQGIQLAERLKAEGWIIGSIGFYTIQFYKPKQ